MSNVLNKEKKQQVIALGKLGWTLRRIEEATGVRRETAGAYLKAAGIAVRLPGGWGRRAPAKPAEEVITDWGDSKPANGAEVITDFIRQIPEKLPIPLPKPGPTSECEPYRDKIERGLIRGRNAKAIWQDMVTEYGFTGGYQTVQRFVHKLRGTQGPERWNDRNGPRRRVPGRLRQRPDGARSAERQVPANTIIRDDAGLQPQGGSLTRFPFELTDVGGAA
jgi:hypothetical protein